MKPAEYAKLIGRSAHFVRLACQQGQIKAIVITHGKRHEYEILEGERYEQETEKQNHQGAADLSVVTDDTGKRLVEGNRCGGNDLHSGISHLHMD